MMKLMKTLIIECNTSEKSFGKTIKEKVISILEKNKRAYDVIDLYKDNFNPIMSEEDEKLYNQGETSDELVKKYQKYIKESDERVFIFPIWWNNVPAMLKGFFDKVFIKEFAFIEENNKPKGLLNNINKGLLITTSESDCSYIKNDLGNPIEKTIIKATLEVVGMSNIKWINVNMEPEDQEKQSFLQEIESNL